MYCGMPSGPTDLLSFNFFMVSSTLSGVSQILLLFLRFLVSVSLMKFSITRCPSLLFWINEVPEVPWWLTFTSFLSSFVIDSEYHSQNLLQYLRVPVIFNMDWTQGKIALFCLTQHRLFQSLWRNIGKKQQGLSSSRKIPRNDWIMSKVILLDVYRSTPEKLTLDLIRVLRFDSKSVHRDYSPSYICA